MADSEFSHSAVRSDRRDDRQTDRFPLISSLLAYRASTPQPTVQTATNSNCGSLLIEVIP